MINKNKLNLYLENNFNVLMSGPHGVGKTAVIKSVFEKANLEWRYFSAATMDPWVDFIGVPKSVKNESGQETLELVKPKDFALDKIEALFFDEFNRAHPKVINAVMELIQFKSINGHKLNNLKVVWAAVNPWDEENTYEVERLDPAVKDRFHIYLDIPYKIDVGYFQRTYGKESVAYIDWWKELPKEIQSEISPRRVEYALKINAVGGALTDVLPAQSNIKKLKSYISRENKKKELYDLLEYDSDKISEKMTLDNTKRWYSEIMKDKNLHILIPYFHKEFIEQKISEGDTRTTKDIQNALSKIDKKKSNEVSKRISETEKAKIERLFKDFPEKLDKEIASISSNFNLRTFAKKNLSAYVDFMENAPSQMEKDYFEIMFKNTSQKSVQKIYYFLTEKAYTGEKLSISSFFPNVQENSPDSVSLYMGLLYKYACLFQEDNCYYNQDLESAQKSINIFNKILRGDLYNLYKRKKYFNNPNLNVFTYGMFKKDNNFCVIREKNPKLNKSEFALSVSRKQIQEFVEKNVTNQCFKNIEIEDREIKSKPKSKGP